MTENTAKNLIGRDLINIREALERARVYVSTAAVFLPEASELLGRIDALVYRHADPELDIAKMWAAGDYGSYPTVGSMRVRFPFGPRWTVYVGLRWPFFQIWCERRLQ